jgi:branched-chain amino acid aminotransferase
VKLWIDGGLVEPGHAALDPRDRGFTLGDGLFETMRAREGSILRLKRHLSRLRSGASVIGLPIPWSDEELGKAIDSTLAENDLSGAAVRLSVSRGVPSRRGLLPDLNPSPTLMISAEPFSGYPASFYERGMSAVTCGIPRNERSPLSNLKTLSYLDNVLARREAEQAGTDEALMLDTKGDLACASAANLFLLLGESLVTPDISSGALPGTMRGIVIETLAPRLGLFVEERRVRPEELAEAGEALLTSALLGVAPLVEVDGRKVGAGGPGPVLQMLAAALEETSR